jgi:hypothetical protein
VEVFAHKEKEKVENSSVIEPASSIRRYNQNMMV